MNLRQSPDGAASEIVGMIVLVTVFVAAAGFLMVLVLSQQGARELPAFTAIITNESTLVRVYHAGGDAIPAGELILSIDGVTVPFTGEGADQVWSIGETLTASAASVPETVQLVYTPGTGQYLLVSQAVSEEGAWAIPTATATASPTVTATTTVTTTTATTTPTPTAAPAPVAAAFTGTPTSGYRPLAVWFTDASTGPVTSWSWTFGDGNMSTAQDPVYTYPAAGTYAVSLTVSNGTGSSTMTRPGYITVTTPAPVANFTGTPRSGAAPLTVSFTDASSNIPASWAWNFGDGVSSALQNPSHQYMTAGTYTVILTATNAGGSDTMTRTGYIMVTSATYKITASAVRTTGDPAPAGWGTISPSGAVTVPYGTDQAFTITEGSKTLVSLVVDGVSRPVSHPTMAYTFTDVTSDHTIVATFG